MQVDLVPPTYSFSRSTVDMWTLPVSNKHEDVGRARHIVGTMDAHDLGIVLAVAKSDQMNWCLVLCRSSLGWTLAAFLQKVPRA